MTQGKYNQDKEGLLDSTENIREVILENILHLHLQNRLSWKDSTFLTKVALRSLKVMKIVTTVTMKVNHHPK
jgi:hypothetical protein